MPATDDLRRALHLLLHDLRAPVAVAQGYVRLIRENRLPDEDTRERALAQTMESLGRLSSLCDEAAEFLAVYESPLSLHRCPAGQLAGAIASVAAAQGFDADVDLEPFAGLTAAVDRVETMASRFGTILDLVRRNQPDAPCGVEIEPHTGLLRMLAGTSAQRARLDAPDPTPVDPWKGGMGVKLALACLEIERRGGRVWTNPAAWPGVGATLSLQGETT